MVNKRLRYTPIPFLVLLVIIAGSTAQTQDRQQGSKIPPRPTGTPSKPMSKKTLPNLGQSRSEGIASEITKALEGLRRCDPDNKETIEWSRTFEGRVDFPERQFEGNATLQIEKDRFVLTVGSTTLRGHVSATMTCGETAVGLTFEESPLDFTKLGAAPLRGISLRAERCGNSLKLKAVSEERRNFVFKEFSAQGISCRPYCPRKPCAHMPVD